MHVFIKAGFGATTGGRVLEMGFGSGLNCWLTLLETEKSGRTVDYVGVEKYPVSPELAGRLDYTTDPRFEALHAAPWGAWTQISPGFRLLKIRGDLTELLNTNCIDCEANAKKETLARASNEARTKSARWADVLLAKPRTCAPSSAKLSGVAERRLQLFRIAEPNLHREAFDVVFWDAFAPDTQPELWTAALFRRIFDAMAQDGVLVTYSAKGDVRRALMEAGFVVEKLPGALGKRHMLRARKTS